jgi:hypothetical protein
VKYMLLLFHEETPVEYTPEHLAPWNAWAVEAGKVCKEVGGHALQPSTTATVVNVSDGKRIVTDGPFADTKEQLGGYYIIDCDNLDIALDLAAKIPWAPTGHIEVRPVIALG